ncbi:MAG: NAD(+) synthase [Propionibacteriaceae bacterium]|nr:NAD(+) synthase [Propionibacteriaceae bacterium]
MEFTSSYAQGFARVAARVLPIRLAQPDQNARAIIEDMAWLDRQGVAVTVYPELCVTGYSCGDLFTQQVLLDAVQNAVQEIMSASAHVMSLVIVGAPVRHRDRVYNCAVVIHRGDVLGVVPKVHLASWASDERRWFAPGEDFGDDLVWIGEHGSHMDPGQLFQPRPGLIVHAGFGEDMWAAVPLASEAVLAGASVVANLAASPAAIGQAGRRLMMAEAASARYACAYLWAGAGPGESSTDQSWDGQTFIYECGDLLGQSERFPAAAAGTVADIDLRRLARERAHRGQHGSTHLGTVVPSDPANQSPGSQTRLVVTTCDLPAGDIGLLREVDRFPFIPSDPHRLAQECQEAYDIQVNALVQRLSSTGNPKPVIGVSGGLDSTQALIVSAKAMDLLGRPRSDILAFTMPGFATSDRTKNSALALMQALGTTYETVDIRPAANQMLADLGHPVADGKPVYDITFENVQAGLRADYLFRLANQRGGMVIGTGDLSESALGWCTYGVGDHISHYGVNAGLPKTLIQFLIRWVIGEGLFDETTSRVLTTIVDQEISPELVPASDDAAMQSTESTIGPYALHDFFLYHFLRLGEAPSRIAYLAWHGFHDANKGQWPSSWTDDLKVSYDLATIRKWLAFFLRRFFTYQYKRSAMPDGPQVSLGGSLSPRGGYKMPSDVSAQAWLAELTNNVPGEDK